jgi:hypothetical protein
MCPLPPINEGLIPQLFPDLRGAFRLAMNISMNVITEAAVSAQFCPIPVSREEGFIENTFYVTPKKSKPPKENMNSLGGSYGMPFRFHTPD